MDGDGPPPPISTKNSPLLYARDPFSGRRYMGGRQEGEHLRLVDEHVDEHGGASAAGTDADGRLGLLKTFKAILACAGYLLVGPTLILVNRHILKVVGFNYPMALSGLGLVGASLSATFLVHVVGAVQLERTELVTRRFVALNLAPIGLAMAATLACGNAVYLYLPVGFIQMLKAFTPTVTLLMLCLLRIER